MLLHTVFVIIFTIYIVCTIRNFIKVECFYNNFYLNIFICIVRNLNFDFVEFVKFTHFKFKYEFNLCLK